MTTNSDDRPLTATDELNLFKKLFDLSQDCKLVFIKSDDDLFSQCINANELICQLLNYSILDIKKLKLNEFFPSNEWQKIKQIINNISQKQSQSYTLSLLLSNRSIISADVFFSLLENNSKQFILISFRHDHNSVEKKYVIPDPKNILWRFYNYSPLIMGIVQMSEDALIMQQGNLALAKFLNVPQNQLFNTSWLELNLPLEELNIWKEQLLRCKNSRLFVQFEYQHLNTNHYQWLFVTVTYLEYKDHTLPQFSFIIEDITERKQAARDLREIGERYRNLIESSPDALFVAIENRIVLVNQACLRLFGAKFEEQLLGKSPYDLFQTDQEELISDFFKVLTFNKDKVANHEEQIVRLDGQFVDVEVTAASFNDNGRQAIHVILRDISERKLTELAFSDSYNLLRTVTDNSPDFIYIKNFGNQLIFATPRTRELLSLTSADNLNIHAFNNLNPLLKFDEDILKNGQKLITEVNFPQGNDQIYYRVIKTPYFDSRGNCIGLVGYLRDITNQKKLEVSRIASLEEKRDKLVKEIHHRIKNHLQGVCGLLRERIQSAPEIRQDLEVAISQINLIARVYGLQSDRTGVHAKLIDLLNTVISALSLSSDIKIITNIQASETLSELPPEELVPLALIINELLTNAVKHTPAGNHERLIQVNLSTLNNQTCLSIANQPASLPCDFDFYSAKRVKIGLDLVRWMLPPKGAKLRFSQNNQQVLVELFLSSEVLDLP